MVSVMVQFETMEKLLKFMININGWSFRNYYQVHYNNASLGDHLWRKFALTHDYDLLKFYANLDNDNRKRVISMMNEFNKLGKTKFLNMYKERLNV